MLLVVAINLFLTDNFFGIGYNRNDNSLIPRTVTSSVGFPSETMMPADVSLPVAPERRDLKRVRESETPVASCTEKRRADMRQPSPVGSTDNLERKESEGSGENEDKPESESRREMLSVPSLSVEQNPGATTERNSKLCPYGRTHKPKRPVCM